MAILGERPPKGLMHHFDRGNQYTSKKHKDILKKNGIIGSMSRKGKPYDNAPMESFSTCLKENMLKNVIFSQLDKPLKALKIGFIITRHSALGGISPLMYEIKRYSPFNLSA